MSLINTKYMERHRLMFRQKRLNDSNTQSHKGSQLWSALPNSYSQRFVAQNENQMNYFGDVFHFNGFVFEYDKHFLTPLRQLTKQLRKAFSTQQSRSKSRIVAHKVAHDLTELKEQLIARIKHKINAIDMSSDDIEEYNSEDIPQTTSTQINKELSAQFDNNCEDMQSTGQQQCKEEPVVYSPAQPLFTQQYIQSLNNPNKRFKFSEQNYRVLSPSELLPSNDSAYSGSPSVCRPPNKSLSTQMVSQTIPQTNGLKQSTNEKRKLEIVNRHKWSNTDYNIATGITLKIVPQNKVRTQRKRKTQLRFVLMKILDLIEGNFFCTKRDLYYQNVSLFDKSQRVVDEIIDDLACSLRASRPQLHIVSSTRGLVFGHLQFLNTNGVQTDCLSSPNGINIPNDTERINKMESKALFVLIIEKDATFQQFIDLKIQEKYPIIMVTGHGYPDLNTRAFVQMIWNTFEIPIFGLVDGDAHGLEILCTFRHGSLALSYESPNLVAPVIKWLGVLPTDIIEFKLSPSVQIDLSERDIKKIQDLKSRVYLVSNREWTKQLQILLKIGKKVEIQSLAEHWPTFLLDVYLPAKIRYGKWI